MPNVWNRGLDACPGDSPNGDSDEIGNDPFDGADDGHFESAGPPRTDRNQRLGSAYGEMGQQGNDRGNDHRRISVQKEKGNNGNGGANGCREGSGYRRSQRLPEPVFGGVQPFL